MSELALQTFSALPSISIDHAVMELSSRLAVVPALIQWDDVGTLLSLQRLQAPDERDNILIGHSMDRDSHGLTVYSTHRLIATLGLTDCLVVDTNDATLICPKDRCQDIRWLTEILKSSSASELIEPCNSFRPWGTWNTVVRQQGFEVRLLEIIPGKQSETHVHRLRNETLIVLSGTLTLSIDAEVLTLAPQANYTILANTPHGFHNTTSNVVRALEIILGDELTETDVYRVPNSL